MIKEGFDIFGNKVKFTDEHENVLNTSLSGNITHTRPFIYDLQENIDVYSIFKRIEFDDNLYYKYNINREISDSNPIVYALKHEKGWEFLNNSNYNKFWYRFEQILNKFLLDHKNEYDTVLCIPSTNYLNTNIINSIKKIANKCGISHIITGGLRSLTTQCVLNSILDKNSEFRKKFKTEDEFKKAFNIVKRYFTEMDRKNNGYFKYHMIPEKKYRSVIINTIEVDEVYDYEYKTYINDRNVLIVDDSITLGQSIKNTIHAINKSYSPKTISVLTMFSELYDRNNNKCKDWSDTVYNRKC